jgi:peptide/nickel transport system permease protein
VLTSYIAGRLVATVPVVFGISVLVFTLLRLTPGDPALMIAGPQATAAELAAVRTSLGLDQPIPLQFVLWLGHALQGDLGRSSQLGVPVAPLVLDRFRNTLILALASLAVALVVAIPTGLISALHRRSPVDHGIMTVTLLANCMPPFWTGLMLIIVFASTLRWFPTGGMTDVLNPGGAQDVLWHLVLPALTLGLPASALISRTMRGSMLDVLKLDHLRTARAKGLKERVVVQRHAIKLAMLPVLTVVGIRFGYLLGGAAITETVFNWPGVGLQLFKAVGARDYAFIQGAVLLIALIFVVVNLAIDLLYAVVDPRIRYGS